MLVPCLAQDKVPVPKAVQIAEPEMAKRLNVVVAPKLPDGVLQQKCSNAMVMLKITVDEQGTVIEEEFTSGYPELREAAISAIKQWAYKPYKRNGKATAVHTQVSIFFLGDGQSFPMYSPDGKGGVRGGNMIPLPSECGSGPTIKRGP
jgi:TonB family protein